MSVPAVVPADVPADVPPVVVPLTALGVAINVEVAADVPGLASAVTSAWSRCMRPSSETAERWLRLRLGADEGELDDLLTDLVTDPDHRRAARDVTGPDVPTLLERLSQHVTYEAISARAGQLVMLHACAVADPATGRCLAFVGPSGMGKTTISSRYGRSWAYVTDETVGVDADLRVWPYPKPLSVIPGPPDDDGVPAVKEQVGPDSLGLVHLPPGELTLGAVVLMDRDEEYDQGLVVEKLPTVEAVAYLAEHSSFLTRLTSPLARLAAVAGCAGPALGARYRDNSELQPLVEQLLGVDR